MKRVLWITFPAILLIFLMTCVAYGENFDLSSYYNSFNTGNLDGQRDWSAYTAGGTVEVVEATLSEHSNIRSLMKSVELVDTSGTSYVTAYRSIADITEGSLSVWMRAEQTNGLYQISVNEGSSIKAQVGFRSNGQISYYNGTTHTNSGVYYEANKWYRFVIEFDCETDKYTFYAYSYEEETYDLIVYVPDLNFKSTAGAINRMQAGTGSGDTGTYQLDDISVYETDGYGSFDTVEVYDKFLADNEKSGVHYRDNIDGGLTWGESYTLESLLVMYQATSQNKYLDTFIEHVGSMIETIDFERESVRDFLSRNNYMWQENYVMYGTAVLYDNNGLPSIEICPVNPNGKSAPSYKYKYKVEDGTNPGSFKLTITEYYLTESYDNLDMNQLSSNYIETRINGISNRIKVHDLTRLDNLAGRPENINNVEIVRQGMALPDTIGLLGYPLAMYADIIDNNATLSAIEKYADARDNYLALAEEMAKIYDDEWHTSVDSGWYTFPKGSPMWCDGADAPINKSLSLGRMLIELYKVTGTNSYLQKAAALANWYKDDLETLYDIGTETYSYGWHYACSNPTYGKFYNGWIETEGISTHTPGYGGYNAEENLHYSAIDIRFVVLAYENGIVFDSTHMEKFVNTFRNGLRDNTTGKEGRLRSSVYGTLSSKERKRDASFYDPDGFQWALLAQFESDYYPGDELIYSTINDIYEKQNQNTSAGKLLASAYLNLLAP